MHDNINKSYIRLDFFGQTYDLKAYDSEVNIQELIDYINDKVKEQQTLNNGLPAYKMMILTILNIGRDYLLAKKQLKEMEEKYTTKAGLLAAKIDSVIEFKK